MVAVLGLFPGLFNLVDFSASRPDFLNSKVTMKPFGPVVLYLSTSVFSFFVRRRMMK
jgi:hypothetical protein